MDNEEIDFDEEYYCSSCGCKVTFETSKCPECGMILDQEEIEEKIVKLRNFTDEAQADVVIQQLAIKKIPAYISVTGADMSIVAIKVLEKDLSRATDVLKSLNIRLADDK